MSPKPLLILLVEDNPDHTELIRRNLENHQRTIRLCHVSDGEEALNYLFRRQGYADAARSPRPHLVLLDLRLPKIDGLEVLRQIKTSEELLRIPVVVLSTSNAEPDILRAYRHYANSYLVKPIDPAQFRELISTIYSYWMRWNNCPWCLRPHGSENLQSA
ncbi:MAG: response regulator [Pirellulales bacterium]|nr:response regulator [Pirellulales bacterium]